MHALSPLSFTHPPDLSSEEKAIRDLLTLSSRLFFSARETTLFQKNLTDLHSQDPRIQNSKIYTKLKVGAEALHLSQCIQKVQLDLERRTVERRIAEAEQRKKKEEYRKRVLAEKERARELKEKDAEAECLECEAVDEREERVRRYEKFWKEIFEGSEVVDEAEELMAEADVEAKKVVTQRNAEVGEPVAEGHTQDGGWPEYNWAAQYGFGRADDQASTTMNEGVTDSRHLEPETELQGEETGEDPCEVNDIAEDGSGWLPDPESLLWWEQPVKCFLGAGTHQVDLRNRARTAGMFPTSYRGLLDGGRSSASRFQLEKRSWRRSHQRG